MTHLDQATLYDGGQKISYFAGPQIRETRFLPVLVWGGNALVGRYEKNKGIDYPLLGY